MEAALTTKAGKEYLTVTLPIEKRPSSSGKTIIVASSGGNQTCAVVIDGKPVVVGFNAYVKI